MLRNKFAGAFILILVAQTALFYSASRGEVTPVASPLSGFPVKIGPWTAERIFEVDPDEAAVLRADDLLSRWYVSPEGGASLFVAYFKTQRMGQAPHSPKNCLPGSGWQPVESGRIDVATEDGPIHINRYLVAHGDDQDLVLYWYQSQGRVIADEFAAKFYLVKDSIRNHRSDTALVRIVVPIPRGAGDSAGKIGIDFVREIYPAVLGYLPR